MTTGIDAAAKAAMKAKSTSTKTRTVPTPTISEADARVVLRGEGLHHVASGYQAVPYPGKAGGWRFTRVRTESSDPVGEMYYVSNDSKVSGPGRI